MATNHTENYGLNLWEADDTFLRTEFNENSQKLDAALKAETDARTAGDAALQTAVNGKATTAALNALSQTVAGKGNCTIVTGSYVGTGTYGKDNPVTLDFSDTVGRPPLVLFVAAENAQASMVVWRGMKNQYSCAYDSAYSGSYNYISWTETGVSWYCSSHAIYQMNAENVAHYYVALF